MAKRAISVNCRMRRGTSCIGPGIGTIQHWIRLMLLLLLWSVCAKAPYIASGMGACALSDDFENIAIGDYPDENGWKTMFSGKSAYVTDEKAHSGSKSFRLESFPNWSRTEYLTLPGLGDQFTCQVSVYVDTNAGRSSRVGFPHASGGENPIYNTFSINSDDGHTGSVHFWGDVSAPSVKIANFAVGSWVTVRADFDFANLTADLWVDGVLAAPDVPIQPREFDDPSYGHVVLNKWGVSEYNWAGGGTGVMYIDDVCIGSTPPSTEEVIVNGDFSAGLSGWDCIDRSNTGGGCSSSPAWSDCSLVGGRANIHTHSGYGRGVLRQEFSEVSPTSFSFSWDIDGTCSSLRVFLYRGTQQMVHFRTSNDTSATENKFTGIFVGAHYQDIEPRHSYLDNGQCTITFDYGNSLAYFAILSDKGLRIGFAPLPAEFAVNAVELFVDNACCDGRDDTYGYFDDVHIVAAPRPKLLVSAPELARMDAHYRVRVDVSAPEEWSGGKVSVILKEERGAVHAHWDIHDNEYWDLWAWKWKPRPEAKSLLSAYDSATREWVVQDSDYQFGTEEIQVSVEAGETAYYLVEPYHRWFWIEPWDWTRIVDIIVSVGGGFIDKVFGGAYTAGAIGRTIAEAIGGQHEIEYTYTAISGPVQASDSTTVEVPWEKYVLLGESIVLHVEGFVATLIGGPPGWAVEAGAIIAGEATYVVASDPPDFNYTQVALPQIPEIPEINEIDDPNELEAAQKAVKLAAVSTAFRVSLERYEGAKIDRQTQYMALQLDAARSYAKQIAAIAEALAGFWRPMAADLPIPSAEEIAELREVLLREGLPDLEVAIFSAFGYSQEQMGAMAETTAHLPDEYFTSPGKIVDALETIAEGSAHFERYIGGPNSLDDSVRVSVANIGYDRHERQFSVDVTITNTSMIGIATPLWLVIESTSDPLITIVESDGRTADEKDYVDISRLLDNGQLEPNESVVNRLYFHNPEGLRFAFDPSVRGVIVEEPAPGPLGQLSGLAMHWLGSEASLDVVPAGGDGIVNFRDFALIAEDWLNSEE